VLCNRIIDLFLKAFHSQVDESSGVRRVRGEKMLHPGLGSSLDPLDSWQVDTQEIDDVAGLYARQLSDARGPEQLARRLGLLWKKLAGVPRLARLIVDYAQFQLQAAASPSEAVRLREPRLVGRVFAALGWTSARRDDPPRAAYIEDDPLYDRWVDT
jgi:hypothetical protein